MKSTGPVCVASSAGEACLEARDEMDLSSPAEDLISDLLRGVRVGGSLVLREGYRAPWAVSIPSSEQLGDLVASAGADRVAAFHYVEHGWVDAVGRDGSPCRLEAGGLVVSFGGLPMELRRGDRVPAKPLAEILSAGGLSNPWPPSPDTTELVCGVFILEQLDRFPLRHGLPDVIEVPPAADGEVSALVSRLIAESGSGQPGAGFMVSRLLELLLGTAIRHAVGLGDAVERLIGVADPVVRAAVRAVQQEPGAPWTVDALAARAAISSSGLTARFRRTLNESPMGFTTRWRMVVANDLLSRTDMSVEQVGRRVGYANQPAFTRAFRRHHGLAPGVWRHKQQA